MDMLKVFVCSHSDFNKICSENDYNDENIENVDNWAFISIIRSETSREAVGCSCYPSEEPHYFQKNHKNVINLEFDDEEEDVEWTDSAKGKSGTYKTISSVQAKDLYDFIKKNIGKNFLIHCRAGVSRSQAIGRFIKEFYPEFNYEERKDNPCLYPNERVIQELKRCYYKENGLFGTEVI